VLSGSRGVVKRLRPIVLAAVVAVTCASAGRATTMPSLTVHVKVTLTANRVVLSRGSAARGSIVEFAVRNKTARRRTFSVSGKTIVVPALKLRLTAVDFQARGKYALVSRAAGRTSVRSSFRVS
jgi:hypothetical protein